MSVSSIVIKRIIPFIVRIIGGKKDTWEEEKYNTAILSLIMIPLKRLKGIRRNPRFVENQYDELSGLYIRDNYYQSTMRYSIVDSKVKKISSIDNMQEIRKEIRNVLSNYEFKSVLEVGVGELTTIEDIYKFFGPDIDCYGVDLSLNRIKHGIEEYRKRHDKLPIVSKANALHLPFPDNSFDLVITRHTLEQMPKIYKEALKEIFRVSKKQVVLFEPSFELGTFAQKLKMLNTDYVRGIPKFLSSHNDLKVEKEYLMKNSANPLNHTACFRISTLNQDSMNNSNSAIPFVCPISKSTLEDKGTYLYSQDSKRAYPVIEDIPVLDPEYSIVVSESSDISKQ